jgi:hypothetical protein
VENEPQSGWKCSFLDFNASCLLCSSAGHCPHLLRVLSPEHFGLTAFAQAVMACFVTLNDYGFNLSATRELAICRDDYLVGGANTGKNRHGGSG